MPALYNNQMFPGGQEKTLVISATAGNVITSLTPTVGLRWQILRGRVTLVCDGTVANRNIRCFLLDGIGGNITEEHGLSPAIIASATGRLQWGEIVTLLPAAGTPIITWPYLSTARPPILSGLDVMEISIGTGVAGDSYSGFIVVLEMAVE